MFNQEPTIKQAEVLPQWASTPFGRFVIATTATSLLLLTVACGSKPGVTGPELQNHQVELGVVDNGATTTPAPTPRK